MSKKYFGTDGIRSTIGYSHMNPDFILKLGWAIGKVFAHSSTSVLIGKDTRISGYMIESALQAGLSSAGANVQLLGPLPTPGIAYLTRTLRAQAGIVISASHNAYPDNGIKCFSEQGYKLDDDTEAAIEAYIDQPVTCVSSAHLGKASRIKDAGGRYIEFCKGSVPLNTRLDDIKIVVDCAHGAAYHVAPYVFHELGARVSAMANQPDGFNINDHCGSTCPEALQSRVLEEQADLGVALDGDGDRVIMVDHEGRLVDGDDILYILMSYLKSTWQLEGGIVGTVMTNAALAEACQRYQVPFERAKVGDRHVMETLQAHGWTMGGEPSGHIVNLNKTTSGDGIVTALAVLEVMQRNNKPLKELTAGFAKLPQKLVNIHHTKPKEILESEQVKEAVAQVESELGRHGRVLLRLSGTEPVIRIMVEAKDSAEVDRHLQTLRGAVVGSAVTSHT